MPMSTWWLSSRLLHLNVEFSKSPVKNNLHATNLSYILLEPVYFSFLWDDCNRCKMRAVSYKLILTDHLPRAYHSQLDNPLWSEPLCFCEVLVELLRLGKVFSDQLLLILVMKIFIVIYDLGDLALPFLYQICCLCHIIFFEQQLPSFQSHGLERVENFWQNPLAHICKLFNVSKEVDFLIHILFIYTLLYSLIWALCEGC